MTTFGIERVPLEGDWSMSVGGERIVPLDLRSGKTAKIVACLESTVPFDDPVEGQFQGKDWMPIQARPRLGRVQLEIVAFVRVYSGIVTPRSAVSPRPC